MLVNYILRRIIQIIPTMLGVFTVLFILAYLMPSDPVRAVLGENYQRLAPEVVAGIKHELGLDQPFLERYVNFLSRLGRGDLGKSYVLNQNVGDIIAYRFPHTLELMTGSMFVALILGLSSALVATQVRLWWVDRLLVVVTSVVASVPVFWMALVTQLFLTQSKFGVALFPVAGYEEGNLSYLILPSFVLGLHLSAEIARVARAALLDVQSQDYILTARAKGLLPGTILLRHQLRNAILPIITVIALDVGYLLGGSIVTETVFNWPGLGRAIVPAIERRDTPVIMGILVFGSFLFITINLATDVLYAYLNPRIRYGFQE